VTREDFSALVTRYERLVYTVCFQLVRNAAAAEDLTQDTFLSAYLHRESMPSGYERQWLARIAANKAKDHLQSAWNRHAFLPGDENLPPGQAPPAELEALRHQGAAAVADAIRNLREPYGAVCRLCLLEERTAEEAALALGRPVKTVRTQILRGKRLLREQLERSEGYESVP
jgi:RNA polymerase sigma factor (sigma-70 family)